MSYLPCELHCNSKNGEGKFTVGEILQRAENDHLALIALTDKNTTDGFGELNDGVIRQLKVWNVQRQTVTCLLSE